MTSSSDGYSYTYDNNGNTLTKSISGGTMQYAWDFENRLTSVTLPNDGGTVSYRYDPFGRRIDRSSSTGTSLYLYDQNSVAGETDGNGAYVAQYVGAMDFDQPFAVMQSGEVSFYQQDGLGSVTSLSSVAGKLTATSVFDSFGQVTASNGSLTNPLRYTAREWDTQANLQFSRSRYFDPAIGRFISEDPTEFDAGVDFYKYVRNNPINFRDPTGLYSLQGFSPSQAAQMSIAIGQLSAKLKNQCCVDPKLRDRLLNLLQPGKYGSGVTFVYKETLPADPGYLTCADVSGGWAFLTNTVNISKAALDGTCTCPLAGTLMHEVTHLTWKNWFGPAPEGGAYGDASACFGSKCSMPQGLKKP